MAKVRVYELAKEFGVESKAVMAKLESMGEFVRSASSTIEAPVVRKLKEAFNDGAAKSGGAASASGVRGQGQSFSSRISILPLSNGCLGMKFNGSGGWWASYQR